MVASESLVDGIWQDAPPSGAANALQALVSRLRRALRGLDVDVESHPAGYRLAVEPDAVDVVRFERPPRAAGPWPVTRRPPRGSCARRWNCGAGPHCWTSRPPTSSGRR
ncbi:hypothetical protein ACFWA6_11505 [Streptomyces sp. NPDC060020]|uniref:AfsR/SARP family transcriptional regulator n=1 Tax=Streptomyces sp. NPDC060020 TaxID=3347038 RepID=UPI00367B0E29